MAIRSYRQFDGDDQAVYTGWLRRIAVLYGAIMVFAAAVVTIQATTHMTTVAMSMSESVAMASP